MFGTCENEEFHCILSIFWHICYRHNVDYHNPSLLSELIPHFRESFEMRTSLVSSMIFVDGFSAFTNKTPYVSHEAEINPTLGNDQIRVLPP